MIPRECVSEVQISRRGSLNFTITLLFLSCALAIAERKRADYLSVQIGETSVGGTATWTVWHTQITSVQRCMFAVFRSFDVFVRLKGEKG